MKNKNKEIVKVLQERLMEIAQAAPIPSSLPPASAPTPVAAKPKEVVVTFDKSRSNAAFNVSYSERGFEINGTRLSFEFIETALAKEINIVLDKGNGIILDSIKMEKILKYKDLYSKRQDGNQIA